MRDPPRHIKEKEVKPGILFPGGGTFNLSFLVLSSVYNFNFCFSSFELNPRLPHLPPTSPLSSGGALPFFSPPLLRVCHLDVCGACVYLK